MKMGMPQGQVMQRWTTEQDDIILNAMLRAKDNNIGNEAAFLAASEQIAIEFEIERTPKAVGERFYGLKRSGKISPILFPVDKPEEEEGGAMDLVGMFQEMKKIIRERDELKAKYEDALGWKIQYEEIKKRLAKIEKESASFMDLLRKRA